MTINGYIKPAELEKLVYKKLKSLGITKKDYPINPYDLINQEGILLHEENFDDPNIRGMLVNGGFKSGILINSSRCYVSRRFIAMHELCHYWFHPRRMQTVCFDEYTHKYRAREWQANNAAAYALLPTKLLTEVYTGYNGDISMICKELHVGTESLSYRIKELGLHPVEKSIGHFYNLEQDPTLTFLENSWLYGSI